MEVPPLVIPAIAGLEAFYALHCTDIPHAILVGVPLGASTAPAWIRNGLPAQESSFSGDPNPVSYMLAHGKHRGVILGMIIGNASRYEFPRDAFTALSSVEAVCVPRWAVVICSEGFD